MVTVMVVAYHSCGRRASWCSCSRAVAGDEAIHLAGEAVAPGSSSTRQPLRVGGLPPIGAFCPGSCRDTRGGSSEKGSPGKTQGRLWQATDPDLDGACSISTDPTTGGVYVGACISRMVIKLDRSGAVVWKVAFPEAPGAVDANPIDGGVYVGYGHYRRFTRRLDADGNVMWQKDYFPSPWTYGRAVSPHDGALFVGSGWPGRLACASMDGTVVFNIPRPDYNENVSAAVDDGSGLAFQGEDGICYVP